MSAAGMRLGVDFGTSNTVAVLRWADGRARPLLFDGSPLLPSAVYAEPGGALVVGRDAVHSARMDPGRFEPNPKRRIDDSELLLGDREIPLVQVISAVLARVAEEVRRTAGDIPADTTLTCPASWGATRRLALADAAAAAGLGQVKLVPEPVAAATYFTQVLGRDVPIGSVVVVYDFGAGTIDVSVVARTSGGFEVLAVDGRDDVGGLDIDAALVDLIGTACADSDEAVWRRLASPTTVEERRARRLLWDDARSAKERLSRHPTADVAVPLVDRDVHITRQELESRARPLLDQTVRVTQGVIRWANLATGRLAGVFLVGGSSRIPLVATLLHQALGEAPVAIEQPELVVAEGSLLAGAAAVPGTASPAPGPSTGGHPRLAPSGQPAAAAAAGALATGGLAAGLPGAGHAGAPPVSGAGAGVAPGSGAGGVPVFSAGVAPVSGGPAAAPVSGGPSRPVSPSAGRVSVANAAAPPADAARAGASAAPPDVSGAGNGGQAGDVGNGGSAKSPAGGLARTRPMERPTTPPHGSAAVPPRGSAGQAGPPPAAVSPAAAPGGADPWAASAHTVAAPWPDAGNAPRPGAGNTPPPAGNRPVSPAGSPQPAQSHPQTYRWSSRPDSERTPEPTPVPRPASARPPQSRPAATRPPQSRPADRGRSAGSGVARAIRILLVFLLLVSVPLVAGYISYKVTVGESLISGL